MENEVNRPSVRKGYLAVLALAVVFSAIQFAGGDFSSKSLQTAVIGDYGYSSQPINYQARNFFCYPGPIQPNDGSKYAGTYNTYMYNYGEAYANSGVKGTWCTNYLPAGDSSLLDDPPLKTSTTNTPTDHTTGYINAAVYKVTDANGQEDTTNSIYRRWQSHINHAKVHENKVVFYENTISGYGVYYKTGVSYGTNGLDPNGSGIYGYSVVHCPAGAVVVDHSTTASQYKAAQSSRHYGSSPTQEDGLYDGGGHKWCEFNGVAVNPVLGPETGKSMPDFASDKSMLYKFTFPNGSSGSADYYKYNNTWNSLSVASANSDWVKCEYGMAGPFVEGTNNHYISPYDSQSNQNKAKIPHYHCLSQNGAGYTEPVKDTVGPPAPFNTWTFLSGIMYSENTCAAGDTTCGGAGTIGAPAPCSRGTYYYQTTDANYRRCLASATPAADTFTPPAPSWTLSAPTNLRITGTKTTGFALTESVPVAADFAAAGTGIPYGLATLTLQISQDNTFATSWTRSGSGAVTAIGTSVNAYVDNFPASGTFYVRAKMSLGTQESAWTSSPYPSFIVCATGKTWNGTSCITPTVATCALDIKLNDGKNPYNKGDMVNYTYSCSPVGTKAASVTVQVVKPDGIATTYNSATNIDTATMGFSTSNLEAGGYVLRACLNATCTSGVASANFTIVNGTTTTTTTTTDSNTPAITLNGTIFKNGQYVDPVTFTLRNCVSPNAWMKEGPTTSGARGFHCMPNYTAVASDYPPTSCTGTLWAGSDSTTTTFSGDYCATSKDSSTSTTTTLTTTPPPTFESPKQCPAGESCVAGSWCNMGQQCYYPDGKLTCTSNWNQSCPTGTKVCSPNDTGCIEPGSKGSSTGWCKNSMECFSGTGEKYCQPWTNDPMKPSACPAEYSKKCSITDTKCIEPNTSGPIDGWCKEAMECYSKDGTKKFCQAQPWSPTGGTTAAAMAAMSCPAEYPKSCRPDDKNCIEIGATGPSSGWCSAGGKQCFKSDGSLYCGKMDESCPADSKACRSTDTNCIEPGQYGTKDGWCGGSGSMQCYKKDGTGLYCLQVSVAMGDPSAWEKAVCPADTGRCRSDDKYCLDKLGATGPSGSWCAVGMSKYKDSTVTCVSSKDYYNNDEDVVVSPSDKDKDKDVCLPTTNPVYNPSSMECKMVATTCNVPAGWDYVADGRICKDGKLVNLDIIVDDTQALIKYIEEKRQYLNDLEMQVKRVPENVADARVLLSTINDAQVKLKSLLQIVKTSKKTVKEELKVFTEVTLPQLEEKWAKLGPYIEAIVLKREVEKEILEYEMELARIGDKTSEYASRLASGVEALKGLLETLEVQVGTAREQILFAVKEIRSQLSELVKGQRSGQTEDSFAKTLAGLVKSAETFRNFIDEKGISDPKVIFMMGRFEKLLSKLGESDYGIMIPYVSEKIEEFIGPSVKDKTRMLNEAVHMRDKIATWLKTFGFEEGVDGDKVSFDDMLQHIDERIAQRVDEVIGKLSNRLELMLDTVTQELTVKVAAMIDTLSEKFQEKATQALSNLTSVAEAHREAIAEAKSKIYDRLEDLESAIEIAKADLGTFTLQPVRNSMEVVASTTWCGEVAENVQSRINSIGLALETGEAEASDLSQFEEDIAELNAGNTEECYRIGATAFRDAPLEEWYYPHAQYNYDHGLMMGYTNSEGERLGQLGVANPTLRIEALAMVMRIFGIGQGDTTALVQYVPGVPAWGIGYVNGALNQGIAFDWKLPMDYPITRLETAKLFVATMRAIEGQNYFTPATVIEAANKYGDIGQFNKDAEGSLAVEALTDVGIFTGGGDGNFHPYDSLLRSEFATTNERLIETYGLLDEEK